VYKSDEKKHKHEKPPGIHMGRIIEPWFRLGLVVSINVDPSRPFTGR